jgi:hypothetical protein
MIRKPGPWRFGLHGQGEMLPRYENAVSLHPTLKDKWGMPLLHVDASHCDNDHRMREDMADTAANILEYLGVKDIRKTIATEEEYPPGLAIHEMGTATASTRRTTCPTCSSPTAPRWHRAPGKTLR